MNRIALHEVEGRLCRFDQVAASFHEVRDWLLRLETLSQPIHEVETELATRGRELLRQMLEEHVRTRGVGDVGGAIEVERVETVGELRVDGVDEPSNVVQLKTRLPLTHRRERERVYHSQFGSIPVNRLGYGQQGQQSVFPADEQMALPERSYSYPLQEKLATAVARGPYAEAVKSVAEATGQEVALASVDDVVVDAARDFEEFYRTRKVSSSDESGSILASAADSKGIPMRVEHRPASGKASAEHPGTKRMANVAAVYTIAPYLRTVDEVVREFCGPRLELVGKRPRPEDKRVWASLHNTKDDTFEAVLMEMLRRDPEHRKTWICLTDGDRALRRTARRWFKQMGEVVLILDVWHASQYLREAGHAFYPDDEVQADLWFEKHLRELLEGRAAHVAQGMRQSATKRGLRGKRRQAVDAAARYFLNNQDSMHYDEYLAAGLPIGSGTAEGAVRNIINDRLERTGMIWSPDNAEAVLRMRSIELSGHTEEYWAFHIAQEQLRLHGSVTWRPVN